MASFFIIIGTLFVIGRILFWIGGEKHEGKVATFMMIVFFVVLAILMFSGDGGSPNEGAFDHLRTR